MANMRTITPLLFVISILFFSCDSGIPGDTRQKIPAYKGFISGLSFNGTVTEKIYCDSCYYDKYQIVINLYDLKPNDFDSAYRELRPFYYFKGKQKLTICVTKGIFEYAREGLLVKKLPGSNSLLMMNQIFLLLDKDKTIWLPVQNELGN